jgi:hypothetical protein
MLAIQNIWSHTLVVVIIRISSLTRSVFLDPNNSLQTQETIYLHQLILDALTLINTFVVQSKWPPQSVDQQLQLQWGRQFGVRQRSWCFTCTVIPSVGSMIDTSNCIWNAWVIHSLMYRIMWSTMHIQIPGSQVPAHNLNPSIALGAEAKVP